MLTNSVKEPPVVDFIVYACSSHRTDKVAKFFHRYKSRNDSKATARLCSCTVSWKSNSLIQCREREPKEKKLSVVESHGDGKIIGPSQSGSLLANRCITRSGSLASFSAPHPQNHPDLANCGENDGGPACGRSIVRHVCR